MTAWAAKRFWAQTTAVACDGGFTIRLDDRAVKTPAKAPLVVPTLAMAQAIAAEWDAQQGKVNPDTMPFTRSANSALDKITPQFAVVADLIAAYGASDLLCYRATYPEPLIARQAAAWDPLLHWAAQTHDAPLHVTHGISPVDQPRTSVDRLAAQVLAVTPFELAALHDLVAISGSLILGLAVTSGKITAAQAWDLSRIDENWQIEQWGADDLATESATIKRAALQHAGRFYELCR